MEPGVCRYLLVMATRPSLGADRTTHGWSEGVVLLTNSPGKQLGRTRTPPLSVLALPLTSAPLPLQASRGQLFCDMALGAERSTRILWLTHLDLVLPFLRYGDCKAPRKATNSGMNRARSTVIGTERTGNPSLMAAGNTQSWSPLPSPLGRSDAVIDEPTAECGRGVASLEN